MATAKTANKEQYEALRHRARTDLFWLAKEVLGYPDLVERVHKPVCDFFVHKDCTKSIGEQDTIKERQLLDPRGHFKTTLNIADCVQWILNFPNIRINIMSGSEKLALRMLFECKEHFWHNDTLRDLFPESCPPIRTKIFGTTEEFIIPNRTKTFLREPTVCISTARSVKASSHFDVTKVDDAVHEKNIGTPDQLEGTITDFKYITPLMEPYGFRDTMGTRYDLSDLYGWQQDEETDIVWIDMPPFGRQGRSKTTAFFQRRVWAEDARGGITGLLFPERFSVEWLETQRRHDPYIFSCFPAGSKVLMSDWTEQPIENLSVGDEIVGYDFGNRYGRLIKATVKHCHMEESLVIEARTESGRIIRCTPDHKFLVARHRERKGGYKPLHIGFNLCSVYTPMPPQTIEEERLLDWLGGIIDGEGSVGSTIAIAQSPAVNPEVCAAIHQTLNDLNIKYVFREDSNQFILAGGKTLKARFLQHATIMKRKRFLTALWKRNGRVSESNDRIISIRLLAKQMVYNIQSSSGNFVCQGLAVANCQYLNDPTPLAQKSFPEEMIISHTLPVTQLPMFGRTFLTWDLGFSHRVYSDFSVGAVGRFNEFGQLFILDLIRGRFSPYELIDAMLKAIKRWSPARMGVEKAGGSDLALPGLTLTARDRRILLPPIDWFSTSPLDKKIDRIAGLHPLLHENKLYFSAAISCREDLIKEFVRFPMYRRNDIPDAISRLLAYRSCVDVDIPADQIEFISSPVRGEDGVLGAGLCG